MAVIRRFKWSLVVLGVLILAIIYLAVSGEAVKHPLSLVVIAVSGVGTWVQGFMKSRREDRKPLFGPEAGDDGPPPFRPRGPGLPCPPQCRIQLPHRHDRVGSW